MRKKTEECAECGRYFHKKDMAEGHVQYIEEGHRLCETCAPEIISHAEMCESMGWEY